MTSLIDLVRRVRSSRAARGEERAGTAPARARVARLPRSRARARLRAVHRVYYE